MQITDSIRYVGVDDTTIDLFESQYVVPEGMAYNSYLILDEKTALFDTVDKRAEGEWEEKVLKELGGRGLDYLIVQHVEPDHTGGILRILERFPEVTLVGNAKTFPLLQQFFPLNVETLKKIVVKEGDTLSLGKHLLHFVFAPMVHWPEVMVTYDSFEKVLFSADAFGKFGALSLTENNPDWACEARRYYFNIVGKYGLPVQTLLKKAAALQIEKICPLHGPVLTSNLSYYLNLYDTWSKYEPETKGVFVAYASIHGNTKKAAERLAEILKEKGVEKVVISDLSRTDFAEAVEDAFRYDRMILCSSSYDAGVFPPMEKFLVHLKDKAFQKRRVGILENGSWAPSAAKTMKAILSEMKEITLVEPTVTIRSSLKETDLPALEALAEAML